MSNPAIFAVDDDTESLELMEQELRKRYSADYKIYCSSSPSDALSTIKAIKGSGDQVAVLLADCWINEMTGVEFLAQAVDLFPEAKRGLLVNHGDQSARQLILHAIAYNEIDAYGSKPWTSPDEDFHLFVSRFLESWAKEHRPQFEMVRVVGDRWARRCYELRDILKRNTIPFGFYEIDSPTGQKLLAEVNLPEGPFPVAVFFDGRALPDPTNTQLADALDVSTIYDLSGVPDELVDLLIVGAGPAGLSAAVYGASEGLHTVVIEREAIGGQAGTSSRIRNYLGFPTGIAGDALAARAYQQAWLFNVDFAFTHEANGLRIRGGERIVTLSNGTEIAAHAVILAMGASYQRLPVPGIERLIGSGVYYGSASTEAIAMKDQVVCVVGGGNSAGQAAVYLGKYASQVIMLVREESLELFMSEYLITEVNGCKNIQVRLNTEVIDGGGERHLEWLQIKNNATGEEDRISTAGLFVLIGATPHTDWLPPEITRNQEGYLVTGEDLLQDGNAPEHWPLDRHPMMLETSIPGVFAVGDVRYRSVKRVASAVGEGSIAVTHVHQYLSG